MSETRPAPNSTSTAVSAPGRTAVFLLDASGCIKGANTAARAFAARDGSLEGRDFSSLFAFDAVANETDWSDARWEIIVQSALDRDITLALENSAGTASDARLRLEKISNGDYLATLEPFTVAPNAPASENFSPLFESSAAGFFDLNLTTGKVFYSPSWKKILGYTDDELPNTIEAWRQLVHPDDSAASPDHIGKKHTVGQRAFSVEFRMRHSLGDWVWINSVGIQFINSSGQLERVVGLHLDISDRKELEEVSFANDERVGLLAGTGPLGIFDLDFVAQKFWFSAAWKKVLGYRESELPDTLETFSGALPPDELPGGVDTWLLLRGAGQATFVEPVELVGKDGQVVPVLLGMHRLLNRKRDLARVIGFITPAPGRTTVSNTTTGSPAHPLIGEALSAVSEGVLLADAAGHILECNLVAQRLLGLPRDSVVGAAVNDVFQLQDRESRAPVLDVFDRALGADQPLPLIAEHALVATDPNCPPRRIVWSGRAVLGDLGQPVGVVIVFRDPAEMNLTPEELVKANRFESLGLVAGGIAHDFNNLLTTILGGISLAKETEDLVPLEDSEKACLAAKSLTKHLLTFAKGGVGTQVVVSTKELLEDALKIASAGADAEITVETADDVEPVRVERAQILQVFQNLLVNALQAMPAPPHRARLQLSARNTLLTEGQIPPLPAGTYVEIEIRDNGSGIAREHLEKIFAPFFTTRKHGTGLGLTTALSIVRKHGGQIGVDSTLGAGSVFTVFLPRATAPADVQALRAPSLRFGTGRVLFMDDDPKILSLTATMLQTLDYKFDLAKNGDEAIQLYKRYLNIGRPHDAVILDLTVVGGMGAEECYKNLRDLDPEVRAIVCSGYDNDDMARRFLDLGFCGYLTKPYRVTDLGKVLRTVLQPA